ncbi:tonB-dependent siderophore receptor family protein [Lysobacter antibioticus]|uniref:TonB-dependent siderophore receptor n=1 Tax=Lysobacter antibioticus TaxID=84531 RepID=UPI000717404E|nr:TonB-dependent siderophore receptor [Lysobacter antibioticus]ALN64277.1 tonB-dependent siderophore receptor family protein [Lysobacter antibioticus]
MSCSRHVPAPLALAIGFCLSFPALAESPDAAADQAKTLDHIVVQGASIGYKAGNASTATKTDTPISETPQAITVVTRERMTDQGALNVQDALNYAAGVRSDAYGLDSRGDWTLIRGSSPQEYLDGLRSNFNYYTSSARTDPYMLERIEVLRGPSSMLFGQGSTAGVINLVSKRPQAQAQREIGVQLGSFDRRQVNADFTGPLTADGTWLYRIVGVYRDSETQVDHVDDDRRLIAPSLTWKPSEDTSLTLQLRWQQDRTGSTSQFFGWSGLLAPNPNGRVPANRFIGNPGDHYDTDRTSAGWLFEHRFNDNWTVRQSFRAARNKVDYASLYGDPFSAPLNPFIDAGQRVINREGWFAHNRVRMQNLDQHVEGRFKTGAVEHQMLLGLDAVRFKQEEAQLFDGSPSRGGTVPPIDIYNPVYTPYTPPPFGPAVNSSQRQVGAYLQDQMRIGDHWIVVAGLRHDRAKNGLVGAADETSNATTKRLGVMFHDWAGWSPYLSYSESFTPVAGTNALTGARYKPQKGEQIEAGLKFEPAGRELSFTAATYELREENRLVPDPANHNTNVQAGKTKVSGFELELTGRVTSNFDITAHYNYLDNDKQLEATPRHQAAVWGKQRFSVGGRDGFAAGLGLRYMSAFDSPPAPTTPSVTLADAMVSFETGAWRWALNVNNLTDKRYFSICMGRGDCWFGARRNIGLSATFTF